MGRTLQDDDLRTWEAYASSGKFGDPRRGWIVFRCLTDPSLRARFVALDRDRADAEKALVTRSDDELTTLLTGANELD